MIAVESVFISTDSLSSQTLAGHIARYAEYTSKEMVTSEYQIIIATLKDINRYAVIDIRFGRRPAAFEISVGASGLPDTILRLKSRVEKVTFEVVWKFSVPNCTIQYQCNLSWD